MVDDSFWTVAGVSKLLDYEGSTKVTVPNSPLITPSSEKTITTGPIISLGRKWSK